MTLCNSINCCCSLVLTVSGSGQVLGRMAQKLLPLFFLKLNEKLAFHHHSILELPALWGEARQDEYHPIIRINKRPMGHIAHLFQSINTFAQSIDYAITLRKKIISFWRIKRLLIHKNLNPLHKKIQCAKFDWNWSLHLRMLFAMFGWK